MIRSATPSRRNKRQGPPAPPSKFKRLIANYEHKTEQLDRRIAQFLTRKRILPGDEVLFGSREYTSLYGGGIR